MLWYSTHWTATLFCNDSLWLSLFVEGVNDRLLGHCQVSSVPHYCCFKEQEIPTIYTVWMVIYWNSNVNIIIFWDTDFWLLLAVSSNYQKIIIIVFQLLLLICFFCFFLCTCIVEPMIKPTFQNEKRETNLLEADVHVEGEGLPRVTHRGYAKLSVRWSNAWYQLHSIGAGIVPHLHTHMISLSFLISIQSIACIYCMNTMTDSI